MLLCPPSSSSLRTEQGRGESGVGDADSGGPGARRRAGAGGKGKGPAGNRFPLLIWAEAVCRGGTMATGGAALRGSTVARGRGETLREARAFYCPPHLGLEWNEEAARRWPAAAGGGARSGGAAQLGRRLAAVVGVVVVVGDARGLFIGGMRRWGCSTAGW